MVTVYQAPMRLSLANAHGWKTPNLMHIFAQACSVADREAGESQSSSFVLFWRVLVVEILLAGA